MQKRCLRVLAVLSLALGAGLLSTGAVRAEDKGETAEAKKLKGRATAPSAGDIDGAATLDALLAKNDVLRVLAVQGRVDRGMGRSSRARRGRRLPPERSPPTKGETDTRKWMIVEVTPAWQKKSASLVAERPAQARRHQGPGRGWLYYEPDEEQQDPRGTRWEIHPVTSIAPAK